MFKPLHCGAQNDADEQRFHEDSLRRLFGVSEGAFDGEDGAGARDGDERRQPLVHRAAQQEDEEPNAEEKTNFGAGFKIDAGFNFCAGFKIGVEDGQRPNGADCRRDADGQIRKR